MSLKTNKKNVHTNKKTHANKFEVFIIIFVKLYYHKLNGHSVLETNQAHI